jgi:hypothetical protein
MATIRAIHMKYTIVKIFSASIILSIFSTLRVLAQDPYLVHVGDSRFELSTTVPSGETPEGTFSYVPIIGIQCLASQ